MNSDSAFSIASAEGTDDSVRIEDMAVERTKRKWRNTSAQEEVFDREKEERAGISCSIGR